MAEREDQLKSLLIRMKEESEKAGFKTQCTKTYDYGIQSQHVMANRRGKNRNCDRDFILLAPKLLWTVSESIKLTYPYPLKENL